MKRKPFGKRLIDGMTEGLAALKKGEPLAMLWRPNLPKAPALTSGHSVKNIRISYGLTQIEFSNLLMVSTKTIQSWEQGTRKPSGAARRILQILQTPEALEPIIRYRLEKTHQHTKSTAVQ